MAHNATIIDILRSARGSDDVLDRLREGSIEARQDKIRDALSNDDWEYGPAELVYTYNEHVLANKDGILVRAAVKENDNGDIMLSNPQIFESPTPVNDIAFEVLETAKQAAELIVDENYNDAEGMIDSILRSIDVKGDLQRRLQIEMALRSFLRSPWYEKFIDEDCDISESLQYGAVIVNESIDEVRAAIDNMASIFKIALKECLAELKANEDVELNKNKETFANDLVEDVRLIINTLQSLDRESRSEMVSVYETIAESGNKYLSGLRSLTKSVSEDLRDSDSKEEAQ